MGLIHLPVFGFKIQVLELLFPIIVWIEYQKREEIPYLKFLVFLFLVVGILNLTPNVILGLGISVLREIGNIYLFILCLLLIILFYGMQKKDLQSSYFLATTILSLIGILTWLWANTSGTQNYWVVFNVDYPIVGDIFRSRGLSMGSSAWFWFFKSL